MKKIVINWLEKYKLHFIIWAVFILYETVVVGFIYGAFGNFFTYVLHYICVISLFYFHAIYSLPWALTGKNSAAWKVPLIIIVQSVVFIGISYGADLILDSFHIFTAADRFIFSVRYCTRTEYRAIYFMGFSTAYYVVLRYIDERKKTDELEKQRLNDIIYRQKTEQELSKAQNAFLKAQINPHFLFNTLDFIYHNVVGSSPVAADAIITLSEMMRYAIDSDKMGDYVLLGEEIDQVENLLFLNQMRKNHNLNFRLVYDEKIRNINIIPLVLLTLVENMFKHGNLTDTEHEAIVNLYIANDVFFIETDNMINRRMATTSNNKGLGNIERRLKFAYGDDVQFNFHADGIGNFKVLVGIPVGQLKVHDGSSKSLKDVGTELLHESVDLRKTSD